MKRIINIHTIIFTIVALCSCEHNDVLENEGINIPIPENGYILFDSEINSRGNLIHGETDQRLLFDDFNVLGYKYKANDWYTAKAMLTTSNDVFDTKPQLVTYVNGTHTYTNVKEWENYTYSFFAWYPKDLTTIVPYNGTPYITYTLDLNNPANHVDVMTACVINRLPSSVKSVQLNMEHRLAALDITATSHIKTTDFGREATVVISSVSIELTNLLYNKVDIPLNTDINPLNNETLKGALQNNTTTTVNFGNRNLLGDNKILLAANSTVNLTCNDNVANTMILIPQDQDLKGRVTVTYAIVDANNNVLAEESSFPSQEVTIGNLARNTRYELLLNFTKSGVSVEAIKGANWDTDINVEHEFE